MERNINLPVDRNMAMCNNTNSIVHLIFISWAIVDLRGILLAQIGFDLMIFNSKIYPI